MPPPMAEANASQATTSPPSPREEQQQQQQQRQQHHPHQTRSASENQAVAGLYLSHGVEIDFPPTVADARPHPVKHMSAPAYQSPIRHHRREPSRGRGVKETLNARSHYGSGDDDSSSVHRINQYVIKQEIGRGSFGAVHLAVDQYGKEYAVKEFSKSRLRKRAQSNLLRQPNARRKPGQLAAGRGFNSPLHRHSADDQSDDDKAGRPFDLIQEEIAIMKKLDHPNVVSLTEVLDDPEEDTLYMVLEMCKKGVVMKVGLEDRAEPYSDEACRCWFRDMILGIEYLHAQGIIHRDLKPDNCLVTQDDVLKIVDFGVSEMFEQSSTMSTAKSAGSPAFMPPELCVAKHGQVSGRAVDIWSMGVTLYCLRYGRIPFEKTNMLELYESIREDPVPLDEEKDEGFKDLMLRILEKDAKKRITMDELRVHRWVTKDGTDPLLSAEENTADLVEPPTEAEKNKAITGNMANVLLVMKAVNRFKALLARKRPSLLQSILGGGSRIVNPPQSIYRPHESSGSRSVDAHDRRPIDRTFASEGLHREVQVDDNLQKLPVEMSRTTVLEPPSQKGTSPDGNNQHGSQDSYHRTNSHRPTAHPEEHRHSPRPDRSQTFPANDHAKGHAHNPLDDTLFLSIGPGGENEPSEESSDDLNLVVSESPPAVEMSIYEQAYQDEMKRILDRQGQSAAMFLNRRVEHREDLRSHSNIVDRSRDKITSGAHKLGNISGLANVVRQAREHHAADEEKEANTSGLANVVRQARERHAADEEKEDKGAQPKLGADSNT